VPKPADVDRYRDLVSRLLDATAAGERKRTGVPESLGELYRPLVRSVAWQESCWLQFVERAGRVTFLESSTDDVGLMQVNRRVWRGVFDLRKLEWDVIYNVDVGTQIVVQMLNRYGRRELKAPGGHPARAAYAAYNGGPSAYRRYRTGQRATRYTRIADGAFWKKFQTTAAGRELAHVPCLGGAA
jgi:soluble lytic murein transglycosylase-like protein